MPYRVFSLEEVAKYLHLARIDVELLVKNQEIPFERRGDRIVFQRQEIDDWASQRILGMQEKRLTEYHRQSVHGTRELFPHPAIIPDLMTPSFIAPGLTAKTKASTVREMVALAESTGRVNDPRDLLASLEERERLCSTGLPGGLALLHPRHHQSYMFDSSFIALGRSRQPIHFGAPDGQPTDLVFLICCQDDRIHLHTLARLCLMAQRSELLPRLRHATDAQSMYDALLASEIEALQKKSKP